jgi:dsRNA-specific ribonuclease
MSTTSTKAARKRFLQNTLANLEQEACDMHNVEHALKEACAARSLPEPQYTTEKRSAAKFVVHARVGAQFRVSSPPAPRALLETNKRRLAFMLLFMLDAESEAQN